jgi:hypothetical protein
MRRANPATEDEKGTPPPIPVAPEKAHCALASASSRKAGRAGSPCGTPGPETTRFEGCETIAGLIAIRWAKPVRCEPPSNEPVKAVLP